MTATYHIGDTRRLSIAFTDISDVAADPTTITFKCERPDGTLVTYVYGTDAELVKDSVGNYHVDWSFAQAGRHFIRWEGTGTVAAAEDTEIHILRTEANG